MIRILLLFTAMAYTLLADTDDLPEKFIKRNPITEAIEQLPENPLVALLLLAVCFVSLYFFWKFNINGKSKNNSVKNNFVAFGNSMDEILSGRFEEHVNKLANYQYLTEEQKKLYKNDFYQKHSALMNGKTVYPIETQKEMIEIREILDGRNP